MTSREGIRLVFQDIDGCLNPASGEDFVPGGIGTLSHDQKSMLAQIGQAMDQSSLDHVIINTGRNYHDTAFILEALNSKKVQYALLEHSAYAWNVIENTKIDLLKLALSLNQEELAKRYAFLPRIAELIPWYRETGIKALKELQVPAEDCLDKSSNLSIPMPAGMNGEETLTALRKVIQNDFPSSYYDQLHFCYSNFFVDVIGPILKSDGGKLLALQFGYNIDNCAFIGDSLNDSDLFENFPHAICPQNSHPKIQQLCLKHQGHLSDKAFGLASLEFYQSLKN